MKRRPLPVTRREFLAVALACSVAQPFCALAQDAARQRRLAVLMNVRENDALGQARRAALLQGLKQHGWIEGRNLKIDYRWAGNDLARYPQYIAETVQLAPDVIVVGGGTNIVRPLQQATSTIPIVFVTATDPVGGGLVASLSRPGGNITGLSQREFGVSTKSLELLKQLAPHVTRVAVFRDPTSTGGVGQFGAIQTAAPALKVEVTPLDVRDPAGIERGIAEFARTPNGGVIVTSSSSAGVHRKVLIAALNQHRLAAVYPSRAYVDDGGLAAYGVDLLENYRLSAGYVDRILKGEKPADLPVQQPSKFEISLNLQTARAIGLKVPESLLVRADKVIQ